MTTSSPQLGDEANRVSLDAWLVTDVGVVRDHNEDSATMEPGEGFFIVADGMGGHAAGEVASAMAVETVRKTLEEAKPDIDAFKKAPSDAGRRGLVQLLQNAVLQAHQAVYQRGQTEADKQGMGTTLDVVLIAGAEAFVAHVGDSRTYLVRDGRSSQVTTDHTVAEVLVIEGKLTIEEAQVSPLRTILVNAIGVSADVGVEMAHVTLKRNDRMLLCSDGLHDYFPVEEEIAQRLSTDAPGDALKEMVELAKTRGGHDNITGVAIHIVEVIDSVPAHLVEDSTQPVEVEDVVNPFTDEPTQTAFSSAGVTAPNTISLSPQSLKQTQPMRAVPEDEAGAGGRTVPMRAQAPDKDGTIGAAPTVPPPNRKKTADPAPGSAGAPAAKVEDDEFETKTETTAKTAGGAKAEDFDAKTEIDEKAAPEVDGRPASEPPVGAPVDTIATADTGPVGAPKKK